MNTQPPTGISQPVAIGGDHAGFELKQRLISRLAGQAYPLIDCGTHSAEACDFPDIAVSVCQEVILGSAPRGILVCGSGVGVSVAANKIPGVRASLCHDTYSARQGVEHDDMNVLCIGARVIGEELAMEIVLAFLGARYEPQERHARRVTKIERLEERAASGDFWQTGPHPLSS
jgi:ribose 5-phosphate isomerase B